MGSKSKSGGKGATMDIVWDDEVSWDVKVNELKQFKSELEGTGSLSQAFGKNSSTNVADSGGGVLLPSAVAEGFQALKKSLEEAGGMVTLGDQSLKVMFQPEQIIKAHGKSVEGLPIVAIGVKGGKIVGYDSKGQPVYAGSKGAKALAKKVQKKQEKDKSSKPQTAKTPVSFQPTPAQLAAQSAPADPFPKDLSKLKEVSAGKFKGSHSNRLFEAPDGRKFLFKAQKLTIARAEEAASRFGQLLLPGEVQIAKFVTLEGKSGALIEVREDFKPIGEESETLDVSPGLLKKFQKHFDAIVRHHAFDWIIAQHDSHGEHVGTSGGGLFAIDKGQAWKHLGEDKLPAKGMEHTSEANPNSSKQVYSQFWTAYHAGKLVGDPAAAAAPVFARLEKMTDDQVWAIALPYADAAKVPVSKIVDRFKEARSNWEWFLGKDIPTGTVNKDTKLAQIAVAEPSPNIVEQQEGFEVEEDPAPEPFKGYMTPPVLDAVKELGLKALVPVPIKKGTVTLLDPGLPQGSSAPYGLNYPGVGYSAEVTYKKSKFTITFGKDHVLNPYVLVDYPNGTSEKFKTPNAACDSLYLFANGLDLDMSAKEKKAKGISYSATKMLKIKAFAEELKVPSPQTKPPAKDKTPFGVLKDHGTGVVKDMSIVPPVVQEYAKAHGYQAQVWLVKDNNGLMFVIPQYSYGEPKYSYFAVASSGAVGDQPHTPSKAGQMGLEWAIKNSGIEPLKAFHSSTAPKKTPVESGPPVGMVYQKISGGYTEEVIAGFNPGTSVYLATSKLEFHKKPGGYVNAFTGDPAPVAPGLIADEMAAGTAYMKFEEPLEEAPPPPAVTADALANISWWLGFTQSGKVLEGTNKLTDTTYYWNFANMLMTKKHDGKISKQEMAISSAQAIFQHLSDVVIHEPDSPPATSVPAASSVVQTMPEEMTSEQASTPVKSKLPLVEAFEHLDFVKKHPGVFKLKASNNKVGFYNIVTNAKAVSNDEGVSLLQALVEQHGIKKLFDHHPNSNYIGAYLTVDEDEVQKVHEVVAPAGEVNPVAAKNNFETMPEAEAKADPKTGKKQKLKTIAKSNTVKVKLQKLEALEVGTKVVFGDGGAFVKTKSHSGNVTYATKSIFGIPDGINYSDYAVAQQIGFKGGCTLLPPEGSLQVTLPKPKLKKTPVKFIKKPVDPEVEAKKVWAQQWKSPGPQVLKHLSHLAREVGLEGVELYVRKSDDGRVVFGDGTSETVKDFLDVSPFAGKSVDTPFGPMVEVLDADLMSATPEAYTTKGPDGATYPAGTTFEQEKIYKTVGQLLKSEPGKLAPYVGPDKALYDYTFKVPNASVEEVQKVQNKYSINTPVKEGSHYTMFPVPKGALETPTSEFELKVSPKVPVQPKPVVQKNLGVSFGPAGYGEPVSVNRDDLSDLGSVVPGRFGYKITCGIGGTLLDGGLRVFRVKMPDGKVVYRVVGELLEFAVSKPGFTSTVQPAWHESGKAHTVLKGWANENHFDEETGTHVFNTGEIWTDGNAASGSTGKVLSDGQSRVYQFGSHMQTLRRHVMVEVPDGADVEQVLAEALTELGHDPDRILATPDEADLRVAAKQQYLAALMGPKGRQAVAELRSDHLDDTSDWEKVLDQNLKGKAKKADVDALEVVSGANGMHVVRSRDLDDKIGVDKDLKGIVTGISWMGMVNLLIQGGYGGQWHRTVTGNSKSINSSGPTTSASDDMVKGGGFGAFCRLVSSKVKSVSGVADGKPKVVWHPRVLRQTNWYAHNGDQYGSQTTSGVKRKNVATGISNGTNEVCFEDLDNADLGGFVVGTSTEKSDLLQAAAKAGITELNGLPLDACVVVGGVAHGLDKTLAKLPLMKEPV